MNPPRTRNTTRRPDPAPRGHVSSSRRTFSSSSFSSLSSCSSSSVVFPGDSPLNSPATPLRLLGVPFSWEHLPGKPKEPQDLGNIEPINLLPLPPHRSSHFPTAGNNCTNPKSRKKNATSPVKDPFTAALMECSKRDDEDEDDEGDRLERRINGGSSKALSKSNVGDRFGIVNLYGSCRKTCAVSESIVSLPRSSGASSYHRLLLRRRR